MGADALQRHGCEIFHHHAGFGIAHADQSIGIDFVSLIDERLQRLLDDACEALSTHFFGASSLVDQMRERLPEARDQDALQQLMLHLAGAITALQFQDMSTQLIAHTSQRLRNCSDQLARDTFGDDEDGMAVVETAPLRPNPVTQDEMDAGSIELF